MHINYASVFVTFFLLFYFFLLPYLVQNPGTGGIGVTVGGIKSTALSEGIRKSDSFSASGAISSLTYVTETPTNLTSTSIELNSSADLTEARKFILFGDWKLDVKSGKVKNFVANFDQLLEDGGLKHAHNIINFVHDKNNYIRLSSDLWVLINGTADIKYNGTITWSAVDTEILIAGGKTIAIWIDNKATDNHFQGQPIYGVIKSMGISD